MATIIEPTTTSLESRSTRRPYFSAIRWGAVLAGVVSGTASYLLLALLGVAVGLTAVDPQAAEPVGAVPLGAGIWTGISMLVGAFIGGYVAGNMSGLSRLTDGMLHGFVSWGATTLLYAFITVSALGALLGGTFSVLSSTVQGAAQAAPAGGQQNVMDQLAGMITGTGEGQVNAETLSSLQQAMQAGDRDRAVNIMVNNMGFTPERAQQTVDKAMPLFSQQNVRGAAEQTTEALTAASWWLFIGLLLSLALGIAGGAAGVRATTNRVVGDHVSERHHVRGIPEP
ncbi:PhnA-like protein [Sulfurifustis variabilis]|uniref:PhnA-like protein n=1 Tax=Sulfurifustis variabilis TaxID=1675686 RepID=A0A1B4VAQ5_9GAMM|nr:hypothetical protein [Sulfurifustis variabilis]BAU48854.1 PhnA-like protein [Sulfurifustis variabilis]